MKKKCTVKGLLAIGKTCRQWQLRQHKCDHKTQYLFRSIVQLLSFFENNSFSISWSDECFLWKIWRPANVHVSSLQIKRWTDYMCCSNYVRAITGCSLWYSIYFTFTTDKRINSIITKKNVKTTFEKCFTLKAVRNLFCHDFVVVLWNKLFMHFAYPSEALFLNKERGIPFHPVYGYVMVTTSSLLMAQSLEYSSERKN